MIVLPAIPAIVAALTPIVEAAVASAIIGGLIGAGAGAVGCGVAGVQEHGEINREVATNAGHCAVQEGAKGAAIGVALGVIAPAVAPVINVVDDIAAHAIGVVDDIAKPVIGAADDVARPAIGAIDDAVRPVIQTVDDAVSPAANTVGNSAKSVGQAIASPFNRGLNSFRARIYQRLPITKPRADDGWVYVMEDAVSGNSKIGLTSNPAQRLKQVWNNVGHKDVKFTCIIHSHDVKNLEKLLQSTYASQNLPNTGHGIEWFKLSATQVAEACSY